MLLFKAIQLLYCIGVFTHRQYRRCTHVVLATGTDVGITFKYTLDIRMNIVFSTLYRCRVFNVVSDVGGGGVTTLF